RGIVARWPATRFWTPDYFKQRFGDAQVAVVLYDPAVDLTFLDQTVADVHQLMSLREYLEHLESADRKYAIREDLTIFRRFPELLNDLNHFAPFCSNASATDDRYKALWLGPANYVT